MVGFISDDEGHVLELSPQKIDKVPLVLFSFFPPPALDHGFFEDLSIISLAERIMDALVLIAVNWTESDIMEFCLLLQELMIE